jgi:hypothetical protein
MKTALFLGVWELDPTASDYEVGDAPTRASYRVEGNDQQLDFHVEYDLGGVAMSFTYVTHPDGLHHAYHDVNGVIDELKTTLLDERTLETTSWREGTEIAHAVRIISADGDSMKIVQNGRTAEGEAFTNLSVYRKVR